MSTAPVAEVTELVGVYDADGTLAGELRYWFGARLGTAHCSLCELTNGTFRERGDWRDCRATLPVPFAAFHRNDQPDDVREVAAGRYPLVVGRTAAGVVELLGPDELDACHGDLDTFVTALNGAIADRELSWAAGRSGS